MKLAFKSKAKRIENLETVVELEDINLQFGPSGHDTAHELLALDGGVCGARLSLIYSLASSRLN